MLTPRRWQVEAMDRWMRRRRGVVSVVTGAGKTALAILICQRIWDRNPEQRVVIIVPTLALLDQWAVAIDTELLLASEDVALFSGEGRASSPARINVAVINTARALPRDFFGRDVLLIVDECHRAGSPENSRALRVDAVASLGLSATPIRDLDDGFETYVAPALGPIIYEYGYVDAKRDGILSDFALHHFRIPLTTEEARRYATLGSRGKGSKVPIDSPRRNAAAVAIVEQTVGPRLVFHERVASATEIARLLDGRGERVGIYHSHIGPSIRRRNLELFKLGQFTTLVTCRALDEGVNVPDASVAVIAASTKSTRQRIQRLGRVLRPAAGKSLAVVATLFSSEEERLSLEAEADNLSEVAEVRWYEMAL